MIGFKEYQYQITISNGITDEKQKLPHKGMERVKGTPWPPLAGLVRRTGVIGKDSIEGSSGVSSASAESHEGNILSIAYIALWNVCVIPTGFSDEFMMTLFLKETRKVHYNLLEGGKGAN